jgi:hypothetical protein
MKRLLLIWIFSASLDGFSQDTLPPRTLTNCRIHNTVGFSCQYCKTKKPDTTCESMHLSTRDQGFVIAGKALSVRVNGICIQHLQSNGRPFPVHYRVGWCEGKEEVFNRLVQLLTNKNNIWK